MKRLYRLSDAERFRQVRSEGKSWTTHLIVLNVLPNQQNYNRVGISVSRRVGNAVCRNRVRRRIREAVRSYFDVINTGWDLVIVARRPAAQATFHEIEISCLKLLQRASLISEVSLTQFDS